MINTKTYKTWTHEDFLIYTFLTGLIIIASIPQLRTTLIDGTDPDGQLIRIEGVKDALLEHQLPAILYPRTANEYGELGFIYPLALLRILNISLSTVYSTACILSNVTCVLLSYSAVKSITESRYSALIATILFTFLSIRIATLTHTGSVLSSGFVAMFLVLTLAGIYQILFNDVKSGGFYQLG